MARRAADKDPLARTRAWPLRLALTFSCLLAVSVAAAETAERRPQHHVESWTTDTGLPQNSVNGILQTRDGFLWLATFGGLVRYDGADFKVFNPGNTPGLRSSRFLRLFEDADANLWITTENAGLTRYRDGLFQTYTTDDGLPDNLVIEVYYDAEGRLLVGSQDEVAEWRDGRLSPYTPPAGEHYSRPVTTTRDGAVWHYGPSFGLHRHEGGRVTVEARTDLHVGLMFEDGRGRLWLSTQEGRLVVFADGKFTDYAVPGVPRVVVVKFYEDRRGDLWLGLAGQGLLRLSGERLTRYTTADGLAGNDVQTVYEDREGSLWVGTMTGLSRLTPRVVTAYSAADGLSRDNLYPVMEDRQGGLWLGARGGLTLLRGGVFTNLAARYRIDERLIMSLMEDRAGGLWVGTWSGEVWRIKDGRAVAHLPREGIPGSVVRAIYEDREGVLWLGGGAGLLRYRDGHFTRYTKTDGLSGDAVHVIYEDRAGSLWLGTEAGLTRYSGGLFTAYTERDGLSAGIVRSLYEDADGALWVGTYDSGIYRFRDGRFARLTTAEGLFDNGAFQILEDARGYFWVSCNRGVYRVARRELNEAADGRLARVVSTSYGRQDGMLNVECNGGGQPAGVRGADGRFWFPTQKGVVVVDPEAVPANDAPPPVAIEEFVVDRAAVDFRGGVVIRPGQDNFEVHYAGLSFVKPEQVRFKYKLEGFDADWIEADTRRVAYYTQVPPGSYRLRVVAANTDGVWNWEGASVELVVVPPFWRTWWFTALTAASLVGFAFVLYRRRIDRLKLAHAAREEFSRRLIESQEEERRRIAAELHDQLGQDLVVIKNWALVGLGGAAPSNSPEAERLREISETAAHAIEEVREIAYNLGPYQLERLGLARTIEEMIGRVSAPSGVRFSVRTEGLDGALPKESELSLYRVVQEAVTNVVKHSGAAHASLEVARGAGRLRVTVSDDGRGFTHDGGGRGGRGFGLRGMAERVRLLGGVWAVRTAPGGGTVVEIQIPLETGNGHGS